MKEAVSAVCVVESERPSSLAGVKSGIARIDSAAKAINGKKPELEKYNDDAKELCRMADVANRTSIREEQDALNGKVKRSLAELKEQKERLAALALQWDDFEQKSKGFGAAIGACRHRIATVDSTYRSVLPDGKFCSVALRSHCPSSPKGQTHTILKSGYRHLATMGRACLGWA